MTFLGFFLKNFYYAYIMHYGEKKLYTVLNIFLNLELSREAKLWLETHYKIDFFQICPQINLPQYFCIPKLPANEFNCTYTIHTFV